MALLPGASQGNTGTLGKLQSEPVNTSQRWFCLTRTRSYGNHLPVVLRLPAEADTAKMVSMLSADGVLTVEAPVPESSVPALTIIPIKVSGNIFI